jgi:CxxC motif-containing protein (DUF1111 family)
MSGIDSAVLAKFNYGLGLFRHERKPVLNPDGSLSGPGPLHNATSCIACHVRDGRGSTDLSQETRSTVFLLSNDGEPDPVYGFQLQDRAIEAFSPEGIPAIAWRSMTVELADGSAVELRRPHLRIDGLAYGPLAPETVIDARIAPQLVGLGWLAAVDEATIALRADPGDRDGDGVSGSVRIVDGRIGRFGWKADASSLEAQAVLAASRDMGLVSGGPLGMGDCGVAQPDCRDRSGQVRPDLLPNDITLLAFYVAHLGVPDKREHRLAARGADLFGAVGCGACHRPELRTSADAPGEFADTLIQPYTDLLLHDMGPELSGGTGPLAQEWRTPPLWGIGLTEAVSGTVELMHDGRARNFTEAVLWHGGEAQAARDAFARLSGEDRTALLAFLSTF